MKVLSSLSFFIWTSLLQLARAKDKSIYCGACIALVEEMNHAILSVDPKKTIQVGSFRVDPSGNQKLNEVAYSRSELHLTEVVESVCEKMNNFAETTDNQTGTVSFIRTSARNNEPISLTNVRIDPEQQKTLRFACDTIVEDNEEELIKMFQKDEREITEKLCIEMTSHCTKADITAQSFAQAQAVLAGMNEKEERERKEAEDKLNKESEESEENESSESGVGVTEIPPDMTIPAPPTESSAKDEL